MSAEVIQANFEALTGLAGRFTQQSDISAQTLQTVTQAMNRLQNGGWIGQGAEAFFIEMNQEVLPGLRRLVDALAQAGQTAAQINRTMQAADEEAASGFKNDSASETSVSPTSTAPTPESSSNSGPDWGIPHDWLAGVTNSLNSLWQNPAWNIPPDWLAGVLATLTGSTDEAAISSTESMGENKLPAQAGSAGGGSGNSGGGGGGADQAGGQPGGSTPVNPPVRPPDRTRFDAALPQAEITSPYARGGGFWQGQSGGSGPDVSDKSPVGGGLRYQSWGGRTGGGSVPRLVRPVMPVPAETESSPRPSQMNLLPLGLAIASPFVALLGKAIKDSQEGK